MTHLAEVGDREPTAVAARPDPVVPDEAPIEVVELVKRYRRRPDNAVDGLSFAARPGEIFGLLGPNGAGKTTTVGILTTRVRPTGGRATVLGVDVAAHPVEARRRLAVVPQRNNLDRSLSVRQNLLCHAAYHGVPAAERDRRADALLAEFGLTERAKEKPELFSGGQAQRMMIARALMHDPGVLFLDEPTTGLDPAARLFVWDRVRDLRERGVTVLLTTHYMDEAAQLCDRVGIMDHGRLLALDSPDALTRTHLPGSATLECAVALPDGTPVVPLAGLLGDLPGVHRVEPVDSTEADPGQPVRLRIYLTGEATSLVAPVVAAVSQLDGRLTDVRFGQPTLEDVFVHLTGRSLR